MRVWLGLGCVCLTCALMPLIAQESPSEPSRSGELVRTPSGAVVGRARMPGAFPRLTPGAVPSPQRPFFSVEVSPRVSQQTGIGLSGSRSATFATPPFFLFGGLTASFGWNVESPEPTDSFPTATASDPERGDQAAIYSSWAKFPVGSWARLRTTSWSYENGKTTQSVTETRVQLVNVDYAEKRYSLQYDSVFKVGDVDYSKRTETRRFDFWDAPCDESTTVEESEPEKLIIGRRAIPCQTRRVTRIVDKQRETTVVWYSSVFAPYVLQKKTTREPLEPASGQDAATYELYVVQQTAANAVLGGANANYTALQSSNFNRRNFNTSRTLSPNVPGGLSREISVETNPQGGSPLCKIETTLLDYYIAQ